MSRTIFVQIASYRDPDLNNTLKSLYQNAFMPENLRVVVANQFADGDEPVEQHPGLEVINIPYLEAVSACWVRNLIQQEYKGEDYTLQLDSHMRFVFGWDALLFNWYDKLKEQGYNPLITGYVPSFDPLDDPKKRESKPWLTQFDFFAVDGWISFRPTHLNDYMLYSQPIPARFYSAHFAFADGAFSKNVQHDPNYYFHGEEISIGVRAYTHGYDLFHPHRLVCWHEYTRKLRIGNKRLQWDNDPTSGQKNKATFSRNRILFGMEEGEIDFGSYGFGTKRTLAQYERYAGVKFATRQVHPDAINRLLPGKNTQTQQEWEAELVTFFKHTINIFKDRLPFDDYHYLAVSYHDSQGNELHRQDVSDVEIAAMLKEVRSHKLSEGEFVRKIEGMITDLQQQNLSVEEFTNRAKVMLEDVKSPKLQGDQFIRITREFYPSARVAYWVVWPKRHSADWNHKDRITEMLP